MTQPRVPQLSLGGSDFAGTATARSERRGTRLEPGLRVATDIAVPVDYKALREKHHMHPPLLSYDPPDSFSPQYARASPRATIPRAPKTSRWAGLTDLYEMSKRPSPQDYRTPAGLAGRDRSLRPKLRIERLNARGPVQQFPAMAAPRPARSQRGPDAPHTARPAHGPGPDHGLLPPL